MFYTNVIHRRAQSHRSGRPGDANLRDALGELMVEARGYRDGRCTVEHLNAALDRARVALAPADGQVPAACCATRIVRRYRAIEEDERAGGQREALPGAAGDN